MRAVVIAIFALVSAGLARGASLEDAIERLDARLLGIRYVNPADLLADRGSPEYRAAQSLIRQKQCAAGGANPLLRVSVPVLVRMKASVRREELRVDDDSIEIALRVAAVSDLPSEYLRQANSLADAAATDAASSMRAQASRDYPLLKARVAQLVAGYDVLACRRGISSGAASMLMPPSF